jgi:O-antigen/teichoic acid export membrane protein
MADDSPDAESGALERITRHSAIYALGPVAQKAIGFLLLPFVTAFIGGQANYGVVEMSSFTIALAAQILGVNLLHGMTRFYPEYETAEERDAVVTTCFLLLASTTGVAFLAALVFRESGARLLLGSSAYGDAFVLAAAILMLQTLGQVGLRWLQILHRSIAYGVLTTLKTVFEVGLKVWFLWGLGLTYLGALGSVLGGEAAVAGGTLVWILRRSGLRFSKPAAKRLLRYSYPLILGGLPMFVLHQADRAFVLAYRGEDGVGFYALAYKLGTIANAVFLESFGLVWFPFIFGVRDEASARSICRVVMTYFAALMATASLALAVFSPEVVRVMAAPIFFESHRAMPMIVGGYFAWAVYQVATTGLYIRQRTGTLSILVALAAALNLGLNAALVPSLGYLGAAWATLATFAALAVAAWIQAERAMPMGYEARRVLLLAVFAGALYGASLWIPNASTHAGVAMRALLVLVLPAGLWVGGFFRAEEKAELLSIVRGLAGPLLRRG